MSTDEERGVVDRDGRSFAVPNLRIVDGSTLPTQGSANPTLTIMAIAARAADRLVPQSSVTSDSSQKSIVPGDARVSTNRVDWASH